VLYTGGNSKKRQEELNNSGQKNKHPKASHKAHKHVPGSEHPMRDEERGELGVGARTVVIVHQRHFKNNSLPHNYR
jgi:hypothetical protein